MTDHVNPDTLARFRARTLAAREILSVDKHLAQCAECRAALSARATHSVDTLAVASARVLRAVRSAAAHLRYEQLEAYVDEKLTPEGRDRIDRHLERCARCRNELAEMRGFAGVLARPMATGQMVAGAMATGPIAAPTVAGARRGLVSLIAGWLGGSPALSAVSAVLVAVVAITFVVPGGDGAGSLTDFSLNREVLDRPATELKRREFDQSAFVVVGATHSEIADAFRGGDFERVAGQLKEKVDAGDAPAQTALALMYLASDGVGRDVAQAERLLRLAAENGNRSAAHNLGVLYSRGLLGSSDEDAARRWFERAGTAR